MMTDRPGRSFGNIYDLGVEAAAEKLADRFHRSWAVHWCWLQTNGRIIVRTRSDKPSSYAPTDADLVGTYNRTTRVEWIEADLIACLQELSKQHAAARGWGRK